MSKRESILEATLAMIRSEGISAVTTKKVAAAAGCAEGTIFNNFGDKGGLLAAVLSFGLPETQTLYRRVEAAQATPDLGAGLVSIVDALMDFYRASYPLVGSALADQGLFARYAQAHRDGGTGPQQAWRLVHDFLVAQQNAGRLAEAADLETVALSVAGACQNAVWVEMVSGRRALPHEGAGLAERISAAALASVTIGVS
jgi:AcrR family transcriptional regulator